MSAKVSFTDERSIEVPVPAGPADTEHLGKFILNNCQDGYALKMVDEITGGTQRDPYTVGLRVILERVE